MHTFGQTEDVKCQLTAELIGLEQSAGSPVATVRGAKALLAKLRNTRRWDDSRSSISASVQTLFRDSATCPYFKYTDISARATGLMANAATKLTPEQASSEGVSGFRRSLSPEASEIYLQQTQRLSQPGGSAFEIARETPGPFVDEAVRRGGQVRDVGSKIVDKTAPVGQGVVDRLDHHGVTNPLLGAVSLGLLVFMERKLLAIVIIAVLVWLTKQRQISQAKAAVKSVQDRVTGTVDSVTGAADAVKETADKFR
mgnify:CR=1 FL=1|jgi:hypothetical protein